MGKQKYLSKKASSILDYPPITLAYGGETSIRRQQFVSTEQLPIVPVSRRKVRQ